VLSAKLKRVAEDNNGELPSCAWPGGYPLFYVWNSGEVSCPKCANKDKDDDIFTLVDYDINYEDSSLYCDGCSERIESAYAEED